MEPLTGQVAIISGGAGDIGSVLLMDGGLSLVSPGSTRDA